MQRIQLIELAKKIVELRKRAAGYNFEQLAGANRLVA